jgi:stearoyl-CoA desaturase (delta-9 desaturase)
MIIIIFFIIHWYTSLFFQSIFHHRYAAHGIFTMSRTVEKLFFIGCAITQGSSYISARAYGIMHRLHHALTDTEDDPHSPVTSGNAVMMMWDTRNSYFDIYSGKTPVENKYTYNLPEWQAFDKIAHNWITRILWIVAYTSFYIAFATHWSLFLLLPFTIVMGSLQGVAINWWAHRFGYTNYKMDNTSKNILPFDIIFWGEAYHNNHHQYPGRADNANKWFEFDMGFLALKAMNSIGLIRLKGQEEPALSKKKVA